MEILDKIMTYFYLPSTVQVFIAQNAYNVVLFLGLYWLLFCWPLMIIAKKYEESAWMAWVPILNVLLMVRLADKPIWWAIIFFVPALLPVALIYIGISLTMMMRRSPILGVFMTVPVINILLLWYLALSKGSQYFGDDIDRRRTYIGYEYPGDDRRDR